jgi:hypothetical protein
MSRDAKHLVVVAGIPVIGVVLGLTVSALFLILLAGPLVLLIQYAWQNTRWGPGGRPRNPSRALVRDLLGELCANRARDEPRDRS